MNEYNNVMLNNKCQKLLAYEVTVAFIHHHRRDLVLSVKVVIDEDTNY